MLVLIGAGAGAATGAGAAGAGSVFGAGSGAGGLWQDLHFTVTTAFSHSRKWPPRHFESSLNAWVHRARVKHIATRNLLVLIV